MNSSLAPSILALALSAALSVTLGAQNKNSRASNITHVEQPTGIELIEYIKVWPELAHYVDQLRQGDRMTVTADLRRQAAMTVQSDGALNLLAQLEREDGALDSAQSLIQRAVASNQKQPLHHFQQAMIFFARLSKASGLGRWDWHQKTRDAYQRAFDLDPRRVAYRYYLVYTYVQSPGFVGGDKDKALRMAQEGLDLGQKEFSVVRADVHRHRGESAAAFANYDSSIAEGVFKLNSFLAAGHLALEKKDHSRARQYFEWAVRCRPDSPRTHDGLGDYYSAVGDQRAAGAAYEAALRVDPNYVEARTKLAKLIPAK